MTDRKTDGLVTTKVSCTLRWAIKIESSTILLHLNNNLSEVEFICLYLSLKMLLNSNRYVKIKKMVWLALNNEKTQQLI